MAISFVAVSSPAPLGNTGTNIVSITPALPSGTAIGDRVFVFQAGSSAAGATPAGWTAIFKDVQVGPTGSAPADGAGRRFISAYYRDRDTTWSMPAFSLSSTGNNSHAVCAVTLRKDGAETWDAPTFSGPGQDTTDGTGYSATSPSWTVPTGAYTFGVTALNDNVSSGTPGGTTTGGIVLGTWTERYDNGTATGHDVRLVVGTAEVTTGGTGTITWTATLSGSSQGGTSFIAQTASTPGGGGTYGPPETKTFASNGEGGHSAWEGQAAIVTTDPWVVWGGEPGDRAFHRFSGATIPPGSVVTSAKLTFASTYGDPGTCIGALHSPNVDNYVAPTTAAELYALPLTSESAPVSIPSAQWQGATNTVDVTAPIAQHVARSGWASGHALGLVFVQGSGSGWNEVNKGTPTLEVTYTPPAGGSEPVTVTGAGDLVATAPTLAGSATVTTDGSGSLTSTAPTLAGSGTVTTDGDGAISSAAPAVAGSATVTTDGSGSLTSTAPTLAGSGTVTTDGSGSLSSAAPTLAGSGTSTVVGSGDLAAAAVTVTGSESIVLTGSGALSAGSGELAASGQVTTDGAGSLASSAPTLSGSGTHTTPGAGALTAPSPVVAGGDTEVVTGSGAIAPGPSTLSGTGTITVTGSGAVGAPPSTVDADGSVTITGAGELPVEAAAVDALGELVVVGAGELEAMAVEVAAEALQGILGEGALEAAPAELSGRGQRKTAPSHQPGVAALVRARGTATLVPAVGTATLVPAVGTATLVPAEGTAELDARSTGTAMLKPLGVGTATIDT